MGVNQATYASPRLFNGQAVQEYLNAEQVSYIAQSVLPTLPVRLKAATFPKMQREAFLKKDDVKHADGAAYNRIAVSSEDDTYACSEKGVEFQLTDQTRTFYANDFDAEEFGLKALAHKLLIAREIAAATAVFNTSTWTGSTLYTDNSSYPWDTVSTTVIAQINAAKEKVRALTGVIPDTLVIGQVQLGNLLANTTISARFPGAALITEQMLRDQLASIFGLRKLFVGGAIYDSTEQGYASSLADIWSDDYAMVCKTADGGTGLTEPCIGRTFVWDEFDAGGAITMDTPYREEQTKSDVYRVTEFSDYKIIDASYGHLLKVDA